MLALLTGAFLLGCSTSSPWKEVAILNDDPDYELVKLTYSADNLFNGIELELTRYGNAIRGYLNANRYSFPMNEKDPQHIGVAISSERGNQRFLAERFEGGQRLRLPEQAVTHLIETLMENFAVTIRCGYFKQMLLPDQFHRHYQTLVMGPPSFLSKERVNIEWATK
ncbi:MAG: hypothetical protein AAF443_04290 [Chlamydiota bacterium]